MAIDKLHLVLDANVFYDSKFHSGEMKKLKILTDKNMVKVYVPELVKREYTTSIDKVVNDAFQSIVDKISHLRGKWEFSETVINKMNDLVNDASELKRELSDFSNKSFDGWEKFVSAKIVHFRSDDIDLVMDDYFSARGVFTSPKSRKDLPDAMINTSINLLLKEVGNIVVLNKDKAFNKFLKKNAGITVYESLDDFHETKKVVALLHDANFIDVTNYFESPPFIIKISEYLIKQKTDMEHVYLEEYQLSNAGELGDSIYSVSLDGLDSSSIDDVVIDHVAKVSKHQFVANIYFTAYSSISYAADYFEANELEKSSTRSVEMTSMSGYGACDLHEGIYVRCKGKIEINLGKEDDLKVDIIKILAEKLLTSDEMTIETSVDEAQFIFE